MCRLYLQTVTNAFSISCFIEMDQAFAKWVHSSSKVKARQCTRLRLDQVKIIRNEALSITVDTKRRQKPGRIGDQRFTLPRYVGTGSDLFISGAFLAG